MFSTYIELKAERIRNTNSSTYLFCLSSVGVFWFFRGRPRFRPTSVDFDLLRLVFVPALFPNSSSLLSLKVLSFAVRLLRRVVGGFLFDAFSLFSASVKG